MEDGCEGAVVYVAVERPVELGWRARRQHYILGDTGRYWEVGVLGEKSLTEEATAPPVAHTSAFLGVPLALHLAWVTMRVRWSRWRGS